LVGGWALIGRIFYTCRVEVTRQEREGHNRCCPFQIGGVTIIRHVKIRKPSKETSIKPSLIALPSFVRDINEDLRIRFHRERGVAAYGSKSRKKRVL
jgi:hypothetical protein